MSEEIGNGWTEEDYWVPIYDHTKNEWKLVNVLDMPEDIFRKFVCWGLHQIRGKKDGARGVGNMDKIEEVILLQEMQRNLAYFKYDRLNLNNLLPLRVEVERRIMTLTTLNISSVNKERQ